MSKNLHLDARKKEAYDRYLARLKDARAREGLPPDVREAYYLGLKEGYGQGLVDGVKLGLDVKEESEGSFDASEVGLA